MSETWHERGAGMSGDERPGVGSGISTPGTSGTPGTPGTSVRPWEVPA